MEVIDLGLSGLKLLKPRVFQDDRGFFFESYRKDRYAEAGIDCEFVQENHSQSVKGTLRGLHYQSGSGQAKLLWVASGRIFDVAVDIRPESPTFGEWRGSVLDAEHHLQIFVPAGFAHGFCVLSDVCGVVYQSSAVYDHTKERTLRWDDPTVGVNWPVSNPILSTRDRTLGESFTDLARRAGR
jgi:dTDP-4-dehydrorhamnose 3,5-epimerase